MRNKKGQFIKGHTFNLGRRCSDETKKKIKEANIGKAYRGSGWKMDEVIKDKIRQGHLRRGLSVLKNCEVCGKQFRVPRCRIDAMFCSNKCRSVVIMPLRPDRTGYEPWNKGLDKENDDRLMKMAKDRSGKKNWRWNNDATQRWRDKHKRELNRWRKKIFERDNYICQKCGQVGGLLHPHHKILVSENKDSALDLDNGVTLCSKCHHEIHYLGG